MGFSANARRALTLLALALLTACAGEVAPPDHLVLVVFDTLRADRMSLYGHDRPTTPFLGSIADELVVFERFKAVAPWTLPTHATLLTGTLPSMHRAQWGSMKLDTETVTLAEHLGERGFCTAGLSANPLVKPGNGLAQGFETWEHVGGPWTERTSNILGRVPAVLEKARAENCRLFLFLNLMDTHIPYNTEEFGSDFGASGPGPIKNAAVKWAISAGARSLTAAEWSEHRNAYDASVRAADAAAQTIVDLLDGAGTLDRTLLVMTSDHGEGLGAHPEVGHSISVWEEQLAVPLMIRFPVRSQQAERVTSNRSQQELAPSVLDWLGLMRIEGTEGLPNLLHEAHRSIIADYRSYFSEGNRKTNVRVASNYPQLGERIHHLHVAYCDGLKLIAGSDSSRQAFDLTADPSEQDDLFAGDEDPRVRACTSVYLEALRSGKLTPFDTEDLVGDDEPDLDALRSLGYVQ